MDNLLSEDTIKIAGVVKESTVDGPGFRYVIFTQGCPHHCDGCHNPQTHDIAGGKLVSISKIVDDIKKDPLLKGVTISGGEPFLQANKVSKLLSELDSNRYDNMVYTGFKYEDLLARSDDTNGFKNLLEKIDVLIDGKFDMSLKSENVPFRGSTNQRAIEAKNSLDIGEVIEHQF